MQTNELWLVLKYYLKTVLCTEDLALNNLQGLICHKTKYNISILSGSVIVYWRKKLQQIQLCVSDGQIFKGECLLTSFIVININSLSFSKVFYDSTGINIKLNKDLFNIV